MECSKHINESEAKRIWHLHKKGLKPADIALAIERSTITISRVVDIFKKAESGNWDALEGAYGATHAKLLRIAKAHFGNEEQPAPAQTEQQPAIRDNTAIYLGEVLTELRRNNELLQKLVEVWGAG